MKTLKTILGIGILFTGMLLSSAAYTATQDYEKDYPVQNINGIDLTLACELYIKQGDTESLKIEADEDVLDKIKVKQKDSIVYIKTDKKEYDMDDWDVEIYLTVKTLNSIDIGGAVKLENEGTLKSSKLSIDVSGAADIELNIEVEKLLADLSGAVNADLEGKADYVVIDMSGASSVDAEDLISRAVYLDFSGFGKADVHASEVLKVEMSGMGVVRYSGNPGRINTESSGLGVIKSK